MVSKSKCLEEVGFFQHGEHESPNLDVPEDFSQLGYARTEDV